MYRRGLSRGRITELTGAPLRTVGYHLIVARKLQPGLMAERRREARDGRAGLQDAFATCQIR
jgi:hypothetical protein